MSKTLKKALNKSLTMLKINYLFGWIAVITMWLIVNLFPHNIRIKFGYLFAFFIRKTMPYRMLVVKTNIDLCFKNLSENERQKLFDNHVLSLGKGFIEAAMSWFLPAWRLKGLAIHVGTEHVEAAIKKGNGVIILGVHTTGLDLGLPLMSQRFLATGMYRPVKGKFFNYIIQKARAKYFKKMVPQNDLRALLTCLNNKEMIWYACDQDFGSRAKGVFAKFYGVDAYTLPFYAKLAQKTNASVIPATTFRDDKTNKYIVTYLPELTAEQMNDDVTAANTMNETIELLLKGYEEQYYWVHRRFKTRPAGENEIYPIKPRYIKERKNREIKKNNN